MDKDDLSADFQNVTSGRSTATDAAEMEQFMQTYEQGAAVAPAPETADPARPLPPPKPVRRKTDDPIGRLPPPEDKQSSAVSRNLAEIPGAAVAGVESAIKNALGFAIDPLANWLNENVADLSYTREDPKTPTGAVTKSIAEFLTGFIPAIKGLRAVGATGNIAAPMAAGAFADFAVRDPSGGRLADLWKKFELPPNILTDYLSSKPEDTEMEARFKNALEGLGLGVLAEGVFLGARALRAAKSVKGAGDAEKVYLKSKYGELDEQTFNQIIGDPSKPGVEMVVHKPGPQAGRIAQGAADTAKIDPRAVIRTKKPTPAIPAKSAIRSPAEAADAVAAGGKLTPEEIKAYPKLAELSGAKSAIKSEDFEVYVNFARFDEPDEIKFAIGKMAENAKGTIDEATRGVITQKETEKLAGELGMSVTELLARRKGQGFNAEEAVAARQLWAASAEKLVELAKTAASKNAGALDQFAFRKQMAIHSAIQAEVIGARTETARALASWKIPVKGGIERARAVDQVMLAMGGPEQASEMARRLAILAEVGANPAAIARFAEKGAGAASVDAVREAWINGLLSSPATHVVNTMSNTLVAFNSIIERGVAAGIRGFTGGEGVKAQEAAAMAFGMVESVRDAFKLAVRALRTGETSWTFNKMDLPRTHAISSEAFGMSRETGLGRFVDYVGTAVRVPTRLLGAEDEFFKAIGYRMELHAQAARTASQEGLRGFDFGKRVAEIVTNPPESVMINSADAALYNTFTGEMGSFGKAIMNLRNIDHPLNPAIFVLPFVRTPVNLARFAFERSPFAPLVSQWRADIAAGGARADLALAKMSTGTAVMLMAMDIADKGLITGPGHYGSKDTATTEAAQRQGLMPYSVKVGDRWYSYNRTDPFGMTIGFAASIAEAVKRGEISEEEVDEWQEVTAMSIAAVSQVVISKTYLEGFAKFVEMMSDPKRHSQRYVDELFASFLPMTAGMSAAKNLVDPVSREVSSPAEAVMARIAGLSENLPPRRNLWGEEITNESGLGKGYDFLSPIKSKPLNAQPIDREMVRLGKGVERIDKQTSFDGVRANMRFYPKAYDDYVRLAGNDLKHPAWGMGAKDYLNAVVSGKHPMSTVYNMLSDDSRVAFIQAAIGDYRKLAQRQILADPKHAGFASEVRQLKQFSQRNKMPVLGE